MWPIIKKAVNSDLSTPLNTLINNVKSIVNTVNTKVDTVNTNVGSNADPASETGSLHAKLKSGVILPQSIASNQLRLSSDPEITSTNKEWTNMKTIIVMITGIIRVSFDLKGYATIYPFASSYKGHGRIYKNGESIGTERVVTGDSYVTFTEDILCLYNDRIELWAHTDVDGGGGVTSSVKNFRIYFDLTDTPKYGVSL